MIQHVSHYQHESTKTSMRTFIAPTFALKWIENYNGNPKLNQKRTSKLERGEEHEERTKDIDVDNVDI